MYYKIKLTMMSMYIYIHTYFHWFPLPVAQVGCRPSRCPKSCSGAMKENFNKDILNTNKAFIQIIKKLQRNCIISIDLQKHGSYFVINCKSIFVLHI